jgi:hypothetical protein
MADAKRFPHLALPFTIVGAAGGWLSAGIVLHPVAIQLSSDVRLVTAGVTAVLGALIGLLLRRWCAGRRYSWEVDAPDPDERLGSDSWWRHAPVILLAGAVAGGFFAAYSTLGEVGLGVVAGMALALPFLPVCAAVLSAARRAQRARLGSLVAGSDRRAVWGILATALLIATLEGLPDWPAPRGKPLFGPAPVLGLLVAGIACIVAVLAADVLSWRRATRALAQGLQRHEGDDPAVSNEAASRVDLGLGDEIRAQVSRTAAVYRGKDRTLALVQGDPDRALGALRRAIGRGIVGLAVAGAVVAAHFLATTDMALVRYELVRCDQGKGDACGTAGYFSSGGSMFGRDPQQAILLYERGCNRSDGSSCMSLARLYRGNEGVDRDWALVAFFEYRAAQTGVCPEGTRLVRGPENVCVDPLDPRQ